MTILCFDFDDFGLMGMITDLFPQVRLICINDEEKKPEELPFVKERIKTDEIYIIGSGFGCEIANNLSDKYSIPVLLIDPDNIPINSGKSSTHKLVFWSDEAKDTSLNVKTFINKKDSINLEVALNELIYNCLI